MTRRRRNSTLSIRSTANISKDMRKEIQKQGETFETTSSVSTASTATSTGEISIRTTLIPSAESTLTNVSTSSSLTDENRVIRIFPEKVVNYDCNLVSCYEKTEDINSYQSVESIGDEKKLEEMERFAKLSIRPRNPLVPIKIVNYDKDCAMRGEVVTDFELRSAMDPNKLHPQAVKMEFPQRFDVELNFCNTVIRDIELITQTNNRMDIEMKVVKYRDANHMPRCKIQLVRRMAASKMKHKNDKSLPLQGFDIPELELKWKTEQQPPNKKLAVWNLPIQTAGNFFGFFKRMIGT